MTARERIDAAIAARDKATPGPLEVVFKGTIGKYVVEKQESGVHRQLAYCGLSDALLIAAAPDLVDEVIRLRKEVVEYQMALAGAEALVLSHEGTIEKRDREIEQLQKWQDDAFCHVEISRNYLSTELKTMKDDSSGVIDQLKQLKDEADRLIAEVQEE